MFSPSFGTFRDDVSRAFVRAAVLASLGLLLFGCGRRVEKQLFLVKEGSRVLSPTLKQDPKFSPTTLVYELIFSPEQNGCLDSNYMLDITNPFPRSNYAFGMDKALEKASLYKVRKGTELIGAVFAWAGKRPYCDAPDMSVEVRFPDRNDWAGELEIQFAGLEHGGQKAAPDTVTFTVKP